MNNLLNISRSLLKRSVLCFSSSAIVASALILSVILFTSIVGTSLGAQGDSDDKNTESDIPNQSVDLGAAYQSHAKEIVMRLEAKSKQDIRRLGIVVANYGDLVQDSKKIFETIKTEHLEGQNRFYKRQYTWSLYIHKINYKRIRDFYIQFLELYKSRADNLLQKASRRVASVELENAIKRGQGKAKIARNKIYLTFQKAVGILNIAYQKGALAEDLRLQDLPRSSIENYRLSKIFAVSTLLTLEPDPSEKAKISTEYSKDLLDSRGLLVNNTASK